MKKLMIIIMVLAAITGQAQTKIEKLRAKRAELQALQTSIDFVEINPDTLLLKKQVLGMGFTKDSLSIYYLRVNNKSYKLTAFVAQIVTPSGEQYHLIANGDSIRCYPKNINEPIFTISPK